MVSKTATANNKEEAMANSKAATATTSKTPTSTDLKAAMVAHHRVIPTTKTAVKSYVSTVLLDMDLASTVLVHEEVMMSMGDRVKDSRADMEGREVRSMEDREEEDKEGMGRALARLMV